MASRRSMRCAAKEGICAMSTEVRPPSANERIKSDSRFLRGTIADGLTRSETGALADDDQQLTKFHGIYLQDDRDLRPERGRQKMEKAFIFMARLRVPGGVLTRLDVAFSRDQPEKRYVQHALWEARRDLQAWVQDGAVIYVCGDANAMAKDVHVTLQRILDEHGKDGVAALDALRREGRYLRDVY